MEICSGALFRDPPKRTTPPEGGLNGDASMPEPLPSCMALHSSQVESASEQLQPSRAMGIRKNLTRRALSARAPLSAGGASQDPQDGVPFFVVLVWCRRLILSCLIVFFLFFLRFFRPEIGSGLRFWNSWLHLNLKHVPEPSTYQLTKWLQRVTATGNCVWWVQGLVFA